MGRRERCATTPILRPWRNRPPLAPDVGGGGDLCTARCEIAATVESAALAPGSDARADPQSAARASVPTYGAVLAIGLRALLAALLAASLLAALLRAALAALLAAALTGHALLLLGLRLSLRPALLAAVLTVVL